MSEVKGIAINEYLSQQLSEYFPDECVELGENWETIATIFYRAGIRAIIEPVAELY